MHTFKLFQTGFYEVKLRVAIDFHSKENIWKSMATINCLVTNILQNIHFWVNHHYLTPLGRIVRYSQQLEKNAKIVK